jgi:polar amino acid transport system substrate-binding protein
MVLLPAIIWAESLSFVTIDYCPFTCDPLQEAGKEGFMTDVVREVFEGHGYSVEFEMLPYVRAVKAVEEGQYDGIVVVGRDYAPDLVYPAEPTVVQRVAFLVDAESPWRYTGVESLFNIQVGVVRGFHYVDPELVAYLDAERDNKARVNCNTRRKYDHQRDPYAPEKTFFHLSGRRIFSAAYS